MSPVHMFLSWRSPCLAGAEEARGDPDCAAGDLLDWCTWLDFRPWKTKKCSLIFHNKTVRAAPDHSWLVLSCEEPLEHRICIRA